MAKLEHNKIVTVPEPGKVEFVNRPYPRVKPGSVLVKTEISATQQCGKILLYPHGLPKA